MTNHLDEKAPRNQSGVNPWGSSLDTLKEWDSEGAELLLRMGTNPWNSGVLPRKEVELISLTLHCACTNLDEAGTRRHVRGALDAGATRDEILLVLKLGAALAVHSCSLGAPILIEEMKAAGVNAAGGPKPATPACDAMREMGQWNTAWDPFYELSPLWTDDFFAFGASIYKSGIFTPRFMELICIAGDASIPHMYAPGTRRHIKGGAQGWSDSGRDHGSPSSLRVDGRASFCPGLAHSRGRTEQEVTMADFIEVARLDEVPPGKGTVVTVAGKDAALFNVDGTIYAMEDAYELLHDGKIPGRLSPRMTDYYQVASPRKGVSQTRRTDRKPEKGRSLMRNWTRCVPALSRMFCSVVIAFVACLPVTTRAQGSREYLNAPVGGSAFLDFSFSRAQSPSSGDLSLPNDVSVSRVVVPYFLYSFSQNKKYGGVSVSTPFIRVKDADGNDTTVGFADPNIGLHWNIFGLPALKQEEFATFVPRNLVSVHLSVNVPLGSYDRNRAANAGANRWAFTPLINFNFTPDKGVSWFEAYVAGKFYTNNDEFQGNKQLSQKPKLTLTGHYSHNIGRRYWASIGTSYDYGGESFINNVAQNNISNGFRPIAAFNARVGRWSLTVRYENTSTKETDHPRNGLIGIRIATLLW